MSEQYSIKIPVFEGPMDLLLHLLKKNEVDIYDIPISLITHQYLEYIGLMKELNLEIAGEFLVMAATLIQIKSKMLLPVEEQAPEEPSEDPRLELVQRLLEYQAFKEASLALREMGQNWSDALYRTETGEDGPEEEDTIPLFDLSMFDLLSAFKKILEKAPPELQLISKETLTVNDRISKIIAKLEEKETVRFEEFFEFEEGASKSHLPKSYLIITFVAILEILKLGLASVYQEEDFGPIWVVRAKDVPGDIFLGGLPENSSTPAMDTAMESDCSEIPDEGNTVAGQKIDPRPGLELIEEDPFTAADLEDEAWHREAPEEDGENRNTQV